MSLALTLTDYVRADLAAARNWYDGQRLGLGDDFASKFYAELDRILSAPTAQPRFGLRFRKRRVLGFPYSVYDHTTESRLFVVALIHHRRSPEFVAAQLQRP